MPSLTEGISFIYTVHITSTFYMFIFPTPPVHWKMAPHIQANARVLCRRSESDAWWFSAFNSENCSSIPLTVNEQLH